MFLRKGKWFGNLYFALNSSSSENEILCMSVTILFGFVLSFILCYIYIYILKESLCGLDISSWLQIQRSVFDSWHYQIF
jgi:hypothetical protein